MILNGFKYFSIYYINMFQYYIKELTDINPQRLANKYPHITREESIIFSNDGMYKIYKNKIYKYKLTSANSQSIPQFINNYTLLINKNHWKREITYNIPFVNEGIQHIIFIEYTIHPKLKFIIEKMGPKIIDFYFQSNENHNIIKNEMASFLSILSNICI